MSDTDTLIHLVHGYSFLNDFSHLDYIDAIKKGEAWKDIAEKLPERDLPMNTIHSRPAEIRRKENRKPSLYRKQDFYKLRDECLAAGKLFEDPEFPAEASSLYFTNKVDIKWKRPKELTSNPELFVDGVSRFDIKQGGLGDCWLLAGIATLTLNDKLFQYVVPNDQGFKEKYAGIFHFRIWQFGKWIDVVIDDKLPTNNEEELIFVHSSQHREFWSALLEKAYAKLNGSYEAIEGGLNSESLEDLTGGIAVEIVVEDPPDDLYESLLKAHNHSCLLSAGVLEDNSMGLPSGHAYSITHVKMLDEKTKLLRIRNPWGTDTEWTGKWSDDSKEWESIPKKVREEIGLVKQADGEFWIDYNDFITYFSMATICYLNPVCFDDEIHKHDCKSYQSTTIMGIWTKGVSAGGCMNEDTFHQNPQYIVTLKEKDQDSDKCTLIVGLMQKNKRRQAHLGKNLDEIGFYIFKLEKPDKHPRPLTAEYFKSANLIAESDFIEFREIYGRYKLPPGTYVIVPTTKDPDVHGRFLLRIFTEKNCFLRSSDKDVQFNNTNEKAYGLPRAITTNLKGVLVHKGSQIFDADNKAKLESTFKEIAGKKIEIDWLQLQKLLEKTINKAAAFGGFSKQVVRTMIAAVDIDRSGKIGLDEFMVLVVALNSLKNIFQQFDKNNTGFIKSSDLRSTANLIGFTLNTELLSIINLHYATTDGRIAFDDFVTAFLRLSTIVGIIFERTVQGITQEPDAHEWMEIALFM